MVPDVFEADYSKTAGLTEWGVILAPHSSTVQWEGRVLEECGVFLAALFTPPIVIKDFYIEILFPWPT